MNGLRTVMSKRHQVSDAVSRSGLDVWLQVDGGVNEDTIAIAAAAGADTFVAGSAIFGKPDYKTVIDAMRAELRSVSA